MIRKLLVGAVLAVGTLVPAASTFAQTQTPPPSGGSIGIRLLEAPVNRENDPRAKIYIVDHIGQGTTIQRKIEVSNGTGIPRTILLYSGAASIASGDFVTAAGRDVNDVARWTTITPDRVTVPAGQTAQASVTIGVPGQVGDGERYGVLWAEVGTGNTTGVSVVNRVGIRMYLSVGVGAEPKSDFTIDTLTAKRLATGEPAVTAMVRNTGGRALDMSGQLELRNGPGGLTAGPFTAELGTTLGLGQREPVLVKLDKRIPAGPWEAVITLRSGELERSAKATITFPAANGASARPVKTSALEQAKRILLPVAGLVVALAVALLIVLWRRRRREDDSSEVEADLRRFERMIQQQRAGTLDTATEDPEVAIKAAIKQAGRARDKATEEKLKEKLAQYRQQRDEASAPPPAPPAPPAPRPERPIVEPARAVEPEPARAVEPEPARAAKHAPVAAAQPNMADILAGEATPMATPPTRWSNLLDDIRSNRRIEEAEDDEDDEELIAEPPAAQPDVDVDVDEDEPAGVTSGDDDTTTTGLEGSLRGWS